jgi:hypothetical protein
MKIRQTRIGAFIAGLMLVAAACLLLLVGPLQAQGQDPEGGSPGSAEEEAAAAVSARIPLQGRLTDAGGRPLDGSYVIRFRLYSASSGGVVLCEDTNTVSVEQGLFTTDIYGCSAYDVDGKALYLGVRVGSDPEMTDRLPIYPAPYAMSLRPGAQISATLTSNAILHIENYGSSGRGLRAYAMAETGTNYGVVGASRSADGYGGYFYNNNTGDGDGAGLRAESTAGHAIVGSGGSDVYDSGGWFEGDVGVHGTGVNGLIGEGDTGAAVVGHSESHYGVFGYTDRGDQNYGLYTTDNCFAAAYHSSGAIMQIVQNGGQEPLEPGDVAVFSGVEASPGSEGSPVIQVARAAAPGSTAVAGVVHSRYNLAAVAGDPEQIARGGQEVTTGGPVPPGDYLLLVVQGPAQVKASALNGPIQPGDLLSSASQAGRAARAVPLGVEGASAVLPGTILGKALEPLHDGDARIYIYVTLD